MGATKADKIEELWGAFYGSIGTDGTKGAAFQLAIWKIEYDWGSTSSSDFTKGNFQASGNTAARMIVGEQLYKLCREQLDTAQGKVEELAKRVEDVRPPSTPPTV